MQNPKSTIIRSNISFIGILNSPWKRPNIFFMASRYKSLYVYTWI